MALQIVPSSGAGRSNSTSSTMARRTASSSDVVTVDEVSSNPPVFLRGEMVESLSNLEEHQVLSDRDGVVLDDPYLDGAVLDDPYLDLEDVAAVAAPADSAPIPRRMSAADHTHECANRLMGQMEASHREQISDHTSGMIALGNRYMVEQRERLDREHEETMLQHTQGMSSLANRYMYEQREALIADHARQLGMQCEAREKEHQEEMSHRCSMQEKMLEYMKTQMESQRNFSRVLVQLTGNTHRSSATLQLPCGQLSLSDDQVAGVASARQSSKGEIREVYCKTGQYVDAVVFVHADGLATTHGGDGGRRSQNNLFLRRGEKLTCVEQCWNKTSYFGRKLHFWTSSGQETVFQGDCRKTKNTEALRFSARPGCGILDLVFHKTGDEAGKLIGIRENARRSSSSGSQSDSSAERRRRKRKRRRSPSSTRDPTSAFSPSFSVGRKSADMFEDSDA